MVQQCDGVFNPPFELPICISTWKPGEIVSSNNYYPFGLLHNYTATTQNAYQYKYNGKELQEIGMYDYGARMYMPDLGRWGVIDPLAEKHTRHSLYNYAVNNPIRFIDPDGRDIKETATGTTYTGSDAESAFLSLRNQMSSQSPKDDIYLDKNGKVSTICRNTKPDRFFDHSNGNQELFFNDPKGVNKNFVSRKYEIGDRVYYPLSTDAMIDGINSVSSNSLIRNLRFTGSFYALIAKESVFGEADFSKGFLSKYIGEDGRYVYENDSSYNIRFGNTNTIFSLMDAGNAMWGLWTYLLGVPDHEVKAGSQLYELIWNQSFDSPADQRAIFYLRNLLKNK